MSGRIDAGPLLNAVGHLLAGPLQSAINSVFVLQREDPASAPRLASLIADLCLLRQRLDAVLAFPAAQAPITVAPLTVEQLVRDALNGIADPAPVVEILDPEVVVRTDCRRFGVALRAVVHNACEASPPGTAPSVVARVEEDCLRVQVADKGAGAWPEPPDKALDPFFTTKPQSLGLGLTVAAVAVQALGGELHLGRRREGGALVTLSVPL